LEQLAITAALFPDELIESELGEIPRGWKTITIGEIAKHCGGFVQTGPFGSQLHASDYIDNGLPVVMPQDIVSRRIRTDKIARIGEDDAQRLSRHRLQVGDIVFSRRGDVEKHALVSDREQGWLCGTGCLLVRLGPKWPAPAYVSQALDLPGSRAWLRNRAVGATMPNLNTGILSSLPLVIATETLIRAFQEKVDSIDAYINHNNAQSEILTELRETLLPKLLSGELAIEYVDELE
jgi:type I restriction enzyme S subunit